MHNQGTGGFAGLLTNIARQSGVPGYPGDGDQPSSGAHTRQVLGWEPKHPSLLEDLENIQP